MNGFQFRNLESIIDSIKFRLEYHGGKLKELQIDGDVVHIEFDKFVCSDNDVLDIFYWIMNSVVASQPLAAPAYVTNHMLKESTLDVEGDEIIINIIANREFDKNDYY